MIWLALALAVTGVFLSAFFSGTETGFYRATRLRLVLDALAGDTVSRCLFWLSNHPSLYVATTLVGNNLANYLVSLAIVVGTESLATVEAPASEILVPLVLAPVLFVLGELVPKSLFLHAPNRLLRRAGPLFLVFLGAFAPVTGLVWAVNQFLRRLVGAAPEQVRLTLARRELRCALEEGHEAGVLYPAQRTLAQEMFALADQPVARFSTPADRFPQVVLGTGKEEVVEVARRHRTPVVLVNSEQGEPIGYYRLIELRLSGSAEAGPMRRLTEISDQTPHLAARIHVQSVKESLVRVVDAQGKTTGIIAAQRLREATYGSPTT